MLFRVFAGHIKLGIAVTAFYIIGTKYARSEDVLPRMLMDSVVSTGFAPALDLAPVIGMDYENTRAWVDRAVPTESRVARSTLARFAGLRPGDLVALKAHSAPRGTTPRLVIARYALVAGSEQIIYRRSAALGHTVQVDFLDDMEPIELSLGYGQTLHLIDDPERIQLIFGRYAGPAEPSASLDSRLTDKATHVTEVPSRGAYLMSRVHNELQNEMRRVLTSAYGSLAVSQEEQFVDLMVRRKEETILVEVKSSPSPIACIREALGQLLHYSWRLRLHPAKVRYVVVGPKPASTEDEAFVNHVAAQTGLSLGYCTPETYRGDVKG